MYPIRVISDFGNLSEGTYNSLRTKQKILECYYQHWRKKLLPVVRQLADLDERPTYRYWLLCRITGLSDIEFTRGTRYLVHLEFSTKEFVKWYHRLRTELKLKQHESNFRTR